MEQTKLKYMEDSDLFQKSAKLLKETEFKGKTALILDETIFYPQGGGQPYDTGSISNSDGVFRVDEVRFEEGYVYHVGSYESGKFNEGVEVHLAIDSDRRILNSKLQSAGHLIDEAVRNIGLHNLKPAKGFHFPEGPSVEYAGDIAQDRLEEVKSQLEANLSAMISEGFEVKTLFVDKADLAQYTHSIPLQIPEGKPTRVVIVWGEKGIPCGATHVKNISELGKVYIRKIRSGGGVVKISYDVERG